MLDSAVKFIEEKIGDFKPEIGIILGSGLGDLADEFCKISIPYSEIPGFETSTISGHKSRLVFAEIRQECCYDAGTVSFLLKDIQYKKLYSL